jgi:hypothetical protein
MRALGFSKKPTLTVLKRLLRVYGNNWALIEDESYGVLAEAMLDHQQVPSAAHPPFPNPLSWDINCFRFGAAHGFSGDRRWGVGAGTGAGA